jgi:hypothetical protein
MYFSDISHSELLFLENLIFIHSVAPRNGRDVFLKMYPHHETLQHQLHFSTDSPIVSCTKVVNVAMRSVHANVKTGLSSPEVTVLTARVTYNMSFKF